MDILVLLDIVIIVTWVIGTGAAVETTAHAGALLQLVNVQGGTYVETWCVECAAFLATVEHLLLGTIQTEFVGQFVAVF